MHAAVIRLVITCLLGVPLAASASPALCAVDLDGDGATDGAGEQAACASIAGSDQCPLKAARCTVSTGTAHTVPVSVATTRGTLLSADGLTPTLYVLAATAQESSGLLRVPVRLWPASADTVTTTAVVAGQTATLGADFAPLSFVSLTFAPGQTQASVDIPLIDDATPEPTETLRVSLLGAFNADVGLGFADATIVDDDGGPAVWIGEDAATETDASGQLPFTLHLTAPLAEPLTVRYASAAGTATAGGDYTDVLGTVTFSPGETVTVVSVPILIDTAIEGAETVAMTVSVEATSVETCPLDPMRPCFDDGHGARVCSVERCVSAGAVTPALIDPPGVLPNDAGPRSPTGACLGALQIFPGTGERCRLAGVNTTFANCCAGGDRSLVDSMGAVGSTPGARTLSTVVDAVQAAASGDVAAGVRALVTSLDPATVSPDPAMATMSRLLLQGCDRRDVETALLNDSGYCVHVGDYCAEHWPLIGCVQKAKSYCCYHSKLARIVQEQGRAQLPSMGGFGTPDAPNCRGFTPTEFQALDFSKMDMSEYYAEIRTKAQGVLQGEVRRRASAQVGQ